MWSHFKWPLVKGTSCVGSYPIKSTFQDKPGWKKDAELHQSRALSRSEHDKMWEERRYSQGSGVRLRAQVLHQPVVLPFLQISFVQLHPHHGNHSTLVCYDCLLILCTHAKVFLTQAVLTHDHIPFSRYKRFDCQADSSVNPTPMYVMFYKKSTNFHISKNWIVFLTPV